MLRECNNLDLILLQEFFIEHDEYTKDVILAELMDHQRTNQFLCLVSMPREFNGNLHDSIDGFMLAYKNRDSLWIEQIWRRPGSDLATSREALNYAKKWAKDRGMTSLTGETNRDEWRALKRYGFEEYSVIIKCEIL